MTQSHGSAASPAPDSRVTEELVESGPKEDTHVHLEDNNARLHPKTGIFLFKMRRLKYVAYTTLYSAITVQPIIRTAQATANDRREK